MTTYSIREVFNTLQGEGARAGARSVFVRFSGCNLWDGNPDHRDKGKGACARWCDTDFFQGMKMTAEQLLAKMDEQWPAAEGTPRWCVLTGGEPLLQLDSALVCLLRDEGWRIAVETNGSMPFKELDVVDVVSHLTVSPKRGAPLVLKYADELKVVLPGDEAQPWTDSELHALADQLAPMDLFVQPQDPIDSRHVQVSFLHGDKYRMDVGQAQYAANVERCIAFVKRNPHWRLGLQQHKMVNLP